MAKISQTRKRRKKMPRGEFKLIVGNMFGNKTGRLMLEVETLREFGRKRVLIFKPEIDTRSGKSKIKDYHGKTMNALELSIRDPWQALKIVRQKESEIGTRFHIIAFDEVQFFPAGSPFYLVVDELLARGYDVIAAGLALDFKREPFGSTLLLFAFCKGVQDCLWLNPLCAKCGKPAALPQRIINGKPAPYDSPQVQVGGKESYEPRCYECHELPSRPAPPW
jgi:thymidine kinase